MFGGIQDVTKEKNDIYIYQVRQSQWNKIQSTNNSIYECSPTLKKSARVILVILRKRAPTILPEDCHPKSQSVSSMTP